MRVGINPNRRGVLKHPKVVAAAIVHLPNLSGYHKDRLEVVQLSLTTMRKHAGVNAHILIWDNGSCSEIRNWIEKEYRPDSYIRTTNVGKSTARSAIFHMFGLETIIALADDDMFYCPDWLRSQIELLEHFPNVGAVSGYPVRTQFRWGFESTVDWAQTDGEAELNTGKFIPDKWDKDFCVSIGRDYEKHRKRTADDVDCIVTYKGKQAYTTAHHCQFVAKAGRLRPIVEWNDQATSDEREFDQVISDAGLLRLTTIIRYTRHMGNVLDDEIRQLADEMNIRIRQRRRPLQVDMNATGLPAAP